MDANKIKYDLIWELIQDFQDMRAEDDSCQDRENWSDPVLSYNDVETFLYQKLEKCETKDISE